MKIESRFTRNKQVVRDLQLRNIQNRLKDKLGDIRYFGLPSDEMKDVIDWKPLFSEFVAVERGIEPKPWEKQHILMLNAFKNEILLKTRLLRGDIDEIILRRKDEYGNAVDYPFDVVSLDYSGGLLYRNSKNQQYRLKAIRELITKQGEHKKNYLLFISSNLDNCRDGEVIKCIRNIETELVRYGSNAKEIISAFLEHELDEVRLKVYIPHFVNQISALMNYNCETEKTIFYLGNKDTRMMNFRFWLQYDSRTTAPRFPRERLVRIINIPMIEIKDGIDIETVVGLPKLK